MRPSISFVLGFLAIITYSEDYGSLKYYVYDCVSDFKIDNYHGYIGNYTIAPPDTITIDTGVTWEVEYASKPEFTSILDVNFNYYYTPEGHNQQTGVFHGYQNVDYHQQMVEEI